MGITDKITGRAKQAAGDLADDDGLKNQGEKEERKEDARDEASQAEDEASAKREEAARLERKS